MKKIVTMALSVMVFTGVMAQQKAKQASFKAKSNEEVLLNNKSVEGSQSANAEMTLNAPDLKSKAEAKKSMIEQKLREKKEAIDAKTAAAEASTNSELAVGATAKGNSNSAEIGTTAQSNVNAEAKGIVAGSVTSVKNQGHDVVKAVGKVSNGLNSNIKSISSDVKTDLKVITDVNVKPKSINTRVKTATGIKL